MVFKIVAVNTRIVVETAGLRKNLVLKYDLFSLKLAGQKDIFYNVDNKIALKNCAKPGCLLK